nr:hypothetical protein [Legionella impletisoli]
MRKIRIFLLTPLLISSCSSYYTSNGEEKYLQSHNGPELVIPPPLTGTNISGFYDLPPAPKNPRVSIQPPQ